MKRIKYIGIEQNNVQSIQTNDIGFSGRDMFRDLEQRIYVKRIKSLTKNDSRAMTIGQSMLLFFITRTCVNCHGGEKNARLVKQQYIGCK